MSARDAVLHDIHQIKSESLFQRLIATRRLSTELALPLSDEDQVVQANDDASPTKWHLAHTTWFFETFVLKPFPRATGLSTSASNICFNSYYESVGARQPRGKRGLLISPVGRRGARLSRACRCRARASLRDRPAQAGR